ncbi:MAG: lactamase [Herbinix sp.]|jgi:flavorubredoxin|nr:lactamase [Herbinix sp.]
MAIIKQDLHQFSMYMKAIDLTFHQYLLLTEEPILVHTGSVTLAEALLPQLSVVLKDISLKYIFISHFESDECGGLSQILKQYPEAIPICSEVTARQLEGFSICNRMMIKKPGDKLTTNSYELEFLEYPSEMHLWEGLLAYETHRQIFFSSDLMMRFGEELGTEIESSWHSEIKNIQHNQLPDPEKRAKLQKNLAKLNPKYIAPGHGPCLKLS